MMMSSSIVPCSRLSMMVAVQPNEEWNYNTEVNISRGFQGFYTLRGSKKLHDKMVVCVSQVGE